MSTVFQRRSGPAVLLQANSTDIPFLRVGPTDGADLLPHRKIKTKRFSVVPFLGLYLKKSYSCCHSRNAVQQCSTATCVTPIRATQFRRANCSEQSNPVVFPAILSVPASNEFDLSQSVDHSGIRQNFLAAATRGETQRIARYTFGIPRALADSSRAIC